MAEGSRRVAESGRDSRTSASLKHGSVSHLRALSAVGAGRKREVPLPRCLLSANRAETISNTVDVIVLLGEWDVDPTRGILHYGYTHLVSGLSLWGGHSRCPHRSAEWLPLSWIYFHFHADNPEAVLRAPDHVKTVVYTAYHPLRTQVRDVPQPRRALWHLPDLIGVETNSISRRIWQKRFD